MWYNKERREETRASFFMTTPTKQSGRMPALRLQVEGEILSRLKDKKQAKTVTLKDLMQFHRATFTRRETEGMTTRGTPQRDDPETPET